MKILDVSEIESIMHNNKHDNMRSWFTHIRTEIVSDKVDIVPLFLSIPHVHTFGRTRQCIYLHTLVADGTATLMSKYVRRYLSGRQIYDQDRFYSPNLPEETYLQRNIFSDRPESYHYSFIHVKAITMICMPWAIFHCVQFQPAHGRSFVKTYPSVIVGHNNREYSSREAVQINDTSVFADDNVIKIFVSDEFDSPMTYDKPARSYYRRIFVKDFANLEIVRIPMDKFRDSMIHIPDFAHLNPFDVNIKRKIKRNVKVIHDYYS